MLWNCSPRDHPKRQEFSSGFRALKLAMRCLEAQKTIMLPADSNSQKDASYVRRNSPHQNSNSACPSSSTVQFLQFAVSTCVNNTNVLRAMEQAFKFSLLKQTAVVLPSSEQVNFQQYGRSTIQMQKPLKANSFAVIPSQNKEP